MQAAQQGRGSMPRPPHLAPVRHQTDFVIMESRKGSVMKSVLTGAGCLAALIAGSGAQAATETASPSPHYGDIAKCKLLSTDETRVTRLQCNFMPNSGSRVLQIKYVSGECISLKNKSFSVKQLQIVTMPVGTAKVPYQLPVPKSVLSNDFVTGSFTFSATQTSIYANPATPVFAYVDLAFPNPGENFFSNISECTVSISGAFE